jgi:thiosulfate/3-mercaptopyruvate sulfurtransferase
MPAAHRRKDVMYDTLVDPKVLRTRSGDPSWCIVDCRASLADAAHGRTAYAAGHIPGAVFADLADDLSGPIVAGITGRHPLPARAVLADRLGRLGIDASTQVVTYDADNGAFAARLWWLLRWLGHAPVAVLDGGIAAWVRAGGALARGVEQRGAVELRIRSALTRSVDTADVVAGGRDLQLLDARSQARFRGDVEPIDAVAGHIPGAHCLPFEGNLDAAQQFLPAGQLRARFEPFVDGARRVVCYCGSGVTACHNILAMRHAGLPEAALYAGSFSEWIVDRARPVAR